MGISAHMAKDTHAEITQISELSDKTLKQLLKKCSNKNLEDPGHKWKNKKSQQRR